MNDGRRVDVNVYVTSLLFLFWLVATWEALVPVDLACLGIRRLLFLSAGVRGGSMATTRVKVQFLSRDCSILSHNE